MRRGGQFLQHRSLATLLRYDGALHECLLQWWMDGTQNNTLTLLAPVYGALGSRLSGRQRSFSGCRRAAVVEVRCRPPLEPDGSPKSPPPGLSVDVPDTTPGCTCLGDALWWCGARRGVELDPVLFDFSLSSRHRAALSKCFPRGPEAVDWAPLSAWALVHGPSCS